MTDIESPVQAFNSPQISYIKKNNPAELIASVMRLLVEMADYAPVAWNGVTVARISKLLTDKVWALKFDELVYVLKKGLDGGYGKIYGTLQYTELARWMDEYISGEREDAEKSYRDNRVKQINAPFADLPEDPEQAKKFSSFVSEVVEKMRAKEAPPVQDNKPAPTLEYLDEKNWTLFVTNKDLFKNEDLTRMLDGARKAGYTKTVESVEQEIERRKSA